MTREELFRNQLKIPLHNRIKRRWEFRAECGHLLWSRSRRILQHENIPSHILRCWKCQFLELFRYHDSHPDIKSLARLQIVADTTSGMSLAFWKNEKGRVCTGPEMKG